MGAIKLNADEFNATYAQINKAANSDLIESVQNLGALLTQHKDDNEIANQAYENCKALAECYNNGFYDSLCGLKKTYDNLFDLSEYMDKKANIGSVSKADTSFKAGTFDPSKVMV